MTTEYLLKPLYAQRLTDEDPEADEDGAGETDDTDLDEDGDEFEDDGSGEEIEKE